MSDAPIKFSSATEAAEFFRNLGFTAWDAHKLSFSLYQHEWGADKIRERAEAERRIRDNLPGVAQAAARYNNSDQAEINQETNLTGTDLDHDAEPVSSYVRAMHQDIFGKQWGQP